MMETPIKQMAAPIQSYVSGVFLSTPQPHNTERIINTPPYAAYTLPNEGNFCRVGMIPYKTKIIPPIIPYQHGLPSRNHNQTKPFFF